MDKSTSDQLTDCTCNVGYSGPDGIECNVCVGGTYKDTTGSNICTECEFQETTENIASTQEADCICNEGYTFNGNNCVQCGAGTYKTDIGDNTCDICPQHSNSPEGSILLTDCSCNAGYAGVRACKSARVLMCGLASFFHVFFRDSFYRPRLWKARAGPAAVVR